MVRLEAELGRAYLMSGEADLALPVIEQALVRAEAAAQLESIAELLVSRAWAVTQAGRPARRSCSCAGVVPFCDEHGFLNARMRCAMNLSALGDRSATRGAAMAAAQEGLAIARRRRLAGWAGALAGNWAEGAFEVGEWDAILALAADLDAEGLLPADESASIFVGVYMVRAYRGAVDEATEALERVLRPLMDDYQVARGYHDASCHLRFAAGDHEAMRRQAPELLGYREMYSYDAIPAARASLWLRDAPGMREALGERDVSVGRATDLRFAVIRAGLAALEGRADDARAAYLAAESGLRELGIRFELGSPLLEHAVFLADDPSARAAADEARRDLRRAGRDHPPGAAAPEARRRRSARSPHCRPRTCRSRTSRAALRGRSLLDGPIRPGSSGQGADCLDACSGRPGGMPASPVPPRRIKRASGASCARLCGCVAAGRRRLSQGRPPGSASGG